MARVRRAACDVRPAACDVRRAEYDAWAETYPAIAHNPVMRAEQAAVEPLLRRAAARRALDIGTGSGRYLDLLASMGASAVGVDFSIRMLTSRGRSNGRHRVCGDACALPIRSAAVDLVNASLMVGDIVDFSAWAGETARVLVRGGHLVYSDFHPNWTRFGWRRTFRDAAGVLHDLPFEPHAIAHHREALAAAGFAVCAVVESPLTDERDRAVRDFRSRWGDASVVVVLHAIKP